ncbi:DUF5709 domain-containing protein [Brooklawnia cerclae]|uniref:DUF5709 domain-containing protein n=1 Tax=Brooklawnia cerclae TaxID=349934 RepID=A0ABX0SDV7_9ACTN|nr:DUF5709 domain-containing protein [Brooklawnia cerclae]NIH56146.1 hypothetical protein [Brooklawnia cerclae]
MSERDEPGSEAAEFAPDASEQLDQIGPAESLVDRGVDDVLDEGYTPPDHWSPAQGFGSTPAEMRQGETIEQRVVQEVPEEDPRKLTGRWNPNGESREVGSKRAGRLVDTQGGVGEDTESEVLARDVGIDGAGASAEEAAMHIIDESDLANQSRDDDEDGPADDASED